MRHPSAPPDRPTGRCDAAIADPRFSCLLYRFLFFGWLFADMTSSMSRLERHAAWQHNRRMRRYLPAYLRRWAVLFALAFGLGCLSEQWLSANLVAACCYAGSCMAVPVMVVISIAWIFLSRPQLPWGNR